MKNLIIYYFKDDLGRMSKRQKYIEDFIICQIEISLILGWKPEDIIILSNKNIQFKEVHSFPFKYEQNIFKQSRIFVYKQIGIIHLLKNLKISDIIWYHDWDLIQIEKINYSFPPNKDIGIYWGAYGHRTGRPNGGCIFIKPSAIDIIEEVMSIQMKEKQNDDEIIFRRILFKQPDRVDYFNSTYNIGRTRFDKRVKEAEKPIKCFHLKPYKVDKIAKALPIMYKQSLISNNTKKVLSILKKYWDSHDIEYNLGETKRISNKLNI